MVEVPQPGLQGAEQGRRHGSSKRERQKGGDGCSGPNEPNSMQNWGELNLGR
jgi:hypothetical protein